MTNPSGGDTSDGAFAVLIVFTIFGYLAWFVPWLRTDSLDDGTEETEEDLQKTLKQYRQEKERNTCCCCCNVRKNTTKCCTPWWWINFVIDSLMMTFLLFLAVYYVVFHIFERSSGSMPVTDAPPASIMAISFGISFFLCFWAISRQIAWFVVILTLLIIWFIGIYANIDYPLSNPSTTDDTVKEISAVFATVLGSVAYLLIFVYVALAIQGLKTCVRLTKNSPCCPSYSVSKVTEMLSPLSRGFSVSIASVVGTYCLANGMDKWLNGSSVDYSLMLWMTGVAAFLKLIMYDLLLWGCAIRPFFGRSVAKVKDEWLLNVVRMAAARDLDELRQLSIATKGSSVGPKYERLSKVEIPTDEGPMEMPTPSEPRVKRSQTMQATSSISSDKRGVQRSATSIPSRSANQRPPKPLPRPNRKEVEQKEEEDGSDIDIDVGDDTARTGGHRSFYLH
jgi:hypothetical protein